MKSVTDWLDLIGVLLVIASIVVVAVVLIPWPWNLAAGAFVAGVLVTVTSWLIGRGK